MEFLLLCFSWLVTTVLITMITLGLPLLLHLVSPHPSSLTRTARAAYVGLLVTGEGILLHHVLTLLTGRPFASLEHFLGRVLGLFPALLMVQACACAVTFSSSCPSQNTDGGETGEEGAGSLPIFHERHPLLGRGRPREGQACHITPAAHKACQSKGQQQDFTRFSRNRDGKVLGVLLSFLLSYLWTLALVMSVVFYFYPNANSCFRETACFDNEIFLKFPVEDRVARGLQKSKHAFDDGSGTDGDLRGRGLNEIQDPDSTDEGGEPDVNVPLPENGHRDTVAHEGTDASWNRNRHGGQPITGMQAALALDQASAPATPSDKACAESEASWLCVKNIHTEIIFYLCFILPLALSCLLVTWWPSGTPAVTTETEHSARFTPVKAADTFLYESTFSEANVSKCESKWSSVLLTVNGHCNCKESFIKSEVSSLAVVQDHHSKDELCNSKQLLTEHPSMHCSEIQRSYDENFPVDIKERPLSTAPPTQAKRMIAMRTGSGTLVDQQLICSKCRVCICLRDYLLLVCNVLVVEALVCPLLWGARGWVDGGQHRLPPFDLLILPAYSAICFVYTSAVVAPD